MGRKIKDLTGQKFGRLTVLGYTENRLRGGVVWRCLCSCGNTAFVISSDLTRHNTQSCGCLHREIVSARLSRLVGYLSPAWKPKLTDEERMQYQVRGRSISGYKEWRTSVYKRDDYTCQKCGERGGNKLNAHHIEGFADNPELRTELSNGITLCKDCHKDFHHLYGYGSTRDKFEEWIK